MRGGTRAKGDPFMSNAFVLSLGALALIAVAAPAGAQTEDPQSKSATALMSVAITRQWADRGIVSNALNPGAIATGLQRHTGGLRTPVERRKTPEQGAATSVLLAASPLLDGIGGRYFEDCNEATSVTCRPTDFSGGFAAYALDGDNADRLWTISQALTRA